MDRSRLSKVNQTGLQFRLLVHRSQLKDMEIAAAAWQSQTTYHSTISAELKVLIPCKRASPETKPSCQTGLSVTSAIKRGTTVQNATTKQLIKSQKSSWKTTLDSFHEAEGTSWTAQLKYVTGFAKTFLKGTFYIPLFF